MENLQHRRLADWVRAMVRLCEPQRVVWCDGSALERATLWEHLVRSGAARPLNPELRPNSFLVRTDPADVARVEDRTFICSTERDDAGPTSPSGGSRPAVTGPYAAQPDLKERCQYNR